LKTNLDKEEDMNNRHRYGPSDPLVTAQFTVPGSNLEVVELYARRIGFATSEQSAHNHDGPRATDKIRCSACRWFEVHLFKTDDGQYVVHTAGISTYHDEVPLIKLSRTQSPNEVVEILTIRKNGDTTVPAPSARVLAQAAAYDDGIKDAYSLGPIPSHPHAA
jgi:hypothetical protein